MTVKINVASGKLVVETPYSPEFPPAARRIGGQWSANSKSWVFDVRDEVRVRELCRDLFGTSGSEDEGELITAHLELGKLDQVYFWECVGGSGFANQIRWCGRVIARRLNRDDAVELGSGVRLLDGQFESRGGSMKNPQLGDVEGIKVEVRDVPRLMFDRLPNLDGVTLVDEAVNRVALQVEREQLLARLAEIDAVLGDGDDGLCGDCLSGRCHGGDRCECARHDVSSAAR